MSCDLCHGLRRVRLAPGSDRHEPCPRCVPTPIENVAWELRKYVLPSPGEWENGDGVDPGEPIYDSPPSEPDPEEHQ